MLGFSGCSLLARFEPNTLVKTYSLVSDGAKPVVNRYDIKFIIRAREIGSLEGIDSYRFTLELKSRDKVDNPLKIDIVRLNSLALYLPATGDSLLFDGERVAGPDLGVTPQIFRKRVHEYLFVKDVVISDVNERIEAIFEFAVYDRSTHDLVNVEVLTHQFERSEQLEWFPFPRKR